eukprot:352597-Chlamydomonas_euryale.AAC.6
MPVGMGAGMLAVGVPGAGWLLAVAAALTAYAVTATGLLTAVLVVALRRALRHAWHGDHADGGVQQGRSAGDLVGAGDAPPLEVLRTQRGEGRSTRSSAAAGRWREDGGHARRGWTAIG